MLLNRFFTSVAVVIAASASLGAGAEPAADAKTFALLVGISKYAKLPQELWLQYPDKDAKALSEHLASPRGGNIPQDQMLMLTNEKATTAAIRQGLADVLKNRPGANDT